jgi:hypothetical protein
MFFSKGKDTIPLNKRFMDKEKKVLNLDLVLRNRGRDLKKKGKEF